MDLVRGFGHRNWSFVIFEDLDDRFYNYAQMRQELAGHWKAQGGTQPMQCMEITNNEHVSIAPQVQDYLQRHPEVTCLICWTDGAAARVHRALVELGRVVPDEISLLGINNEHYGAFLKPSLTSVNIQRELMGEYAGQMLIQMAEKQRLLVSERLVGSHLVLRESVGQAPAARK